MFRKTLTILSLIGLLLSAGLWGVSCFYVLVVQAFSGYGGVFNGMIAISNLRYDEYLGHVVCKAYDWSQLSPDERWA